MHGQQNIKKKKMEYLLFIVVFNNTHRTFLLLLPYLVYKFIQNEFPADSNHSYLFTFCVCVCVFVCVRALGAYSM